MEEMASNGENGASSAHPCFTCSHCKYFGFVRKDSLDRHLIQVHKEQPNNDPDKEKNTTIQTDFVCSLCHKKFVRQDNLKRHWISVHKQPYDDQDKEENTTIQQSRFFCSHCNKDFFRKDNLKRHLAGVHKQPQEDEAKKTPCAQPNTGKFSCSLCHTNFTRKHNLKRHWSHVHNQEFDDPHEAKKTTCIHPNCDKVFFHRTRMLKHLEDDHDMTLSSSTHRFDTERDFFDWKEREERNNLVQFSKQSGSIRGKDMLYSYYICAHDGSDKPHRAHWQPDRMSSRRNKKGRVKTGAICPARMLVKSELNSSVLRVTYISTHNHEPRPRILSTRSRRTCSRTTPRRTGKPKSQGKKVSPGAPRTQGGHELLATKPRTAHAEDNINDAAFFITGDLGNEDMDSDSDSGAPGFDVSMLEETKGYVAELIKLVQDEQVQRTVLPQIHQVLKKTVVQCGAIKAQAASTSTILQLYQPAPASGQPLPGQREHDYYCI